MVSMAILTATYAVCQPISLPRTVAQSLDVSRGSENAEPTQRAMAVDVAASALEFLLDMRSCIRSTGGVGVETVIFAACFDLRKRGMTMVVDKINLIIGLASRPPIGNVTTAPAQDCIGV